MKKDHAIAIQISREAKVETIPSKPPALWHFFTTLPFDPGSTTIVVGRKDAALETGLAKSGVNAEFLGPDSEPGEDSILRLKPAETAVLPDTAGMTKRKIQRIVQQVAQWVQPGGRIFVRVQDREKRPGVFAAIREIFPLCDLRSVTLTVTNRPVIQKGYGQERLGRRLADALTRTIAIEKQHHAE